MDQAVVTGTDLRSFLKRLENAGELHEITAEVDVNLTVGAISQRLAERGGPAAHFKNIPEAEHGISLVSGILGRGSLGLWSKLAVALGMDPKAEYRDILEDFTRRIESSIRPLQVNGGQCKEVILTGKEVDLDSLAPPTLHDGDGGRYLTSSAFIITEDADSGYVSWDLLPLMVLSKNTLSGRIPKDAAVSQLFRKHAELGKPMPFAIVFGGGPTTLIASALRRGRSSMTDPEIAGALQRSPIHLVKCETNELLVPANAEMILEGVVYPDKQAMSGPFGSPFGYRHSGQVEAPVFEVQAITHRKNPILPLCAWGTPTSDIHIMRGVDSDSQLKAKFEKAGAPVKDVFTPPWLAGSVVAVSTQVPYTAYSQTIAGVVRGTTATKNVPYVFVFDDDIDITNPVELFHALVTKCHPKRDAWIIKDSEADEEAPYLTAEDIRTRRSARAIFDATWPLDWDRSIAVPPKVSFNECYPKALQEKVLSEWVSTLGFPLESDRPV